MQHLVMITDTVIVDRHPEEGRVKHRRVKIGTIQCKDKEQAERVADMLKHRCNLDAEPAIKMWQPGSGSVTLDYTAIERLVEEYTAPVAAAYAEFTKAKAG